MFLIYPPFPKPGDKIFQLFSKFTSTSPECCLRQAVDNRQQLIQTYLKYFTTTRELVHTLLWTKIIVQYEIIHKSEFCPAIASRLRQKTCKATKYLNCLLGIDFGKIILTVKRHFMLGKTQIRLKFIRNSLQICDKLK